MTNKQQKTLFYFSTLALVIVLLFYACAHRNNTSDLSRYIKQKKEESIKSIPLKKAAVPTIETPVPVVYHAESLRPPFGEGAQPNQPAVSTTERGLNPLLAYSISVLKFVGTLKQKGTVYAFILAPDGVIYQVKVGDEVDDQHGRVVSIEEKALIIQEHPTINGKEESQRMVTLQLKGEH